MAEWRNVAGGEGGSVDNWWTNGNNQIAFSRNGAAFIAFNNQVQLLFCCFYFALTFLNQDYTFRGHLGVVANSVTSSLQG